MRSRRLLQGLLMLLAAAAGGVQGAEPLTVVSWGGAYVRSQMLGFILPFERQSERYYANVLEYSGGIGEIRDQVSSWNVRWDVVDLEQFDAERACAEGLLEPVDHEQLAPAPDGTPASEDFIPGSLLPCGVGNIVAATVVAFDPQVLERAPQSISDFFDVRRFPGRRGLRRAPEVSLEWALIADGVPREKVYQVLATPEGVERALTVLTQIKPWIEWWDNGDQALALLESGQVSMSSVFSGRAQDAISQGQRWSILWDHQVQFMDFWAVPRHGRRTEAAFDFIRFATRTESLAAQQAHIAYGPVRYSVIEQLAPEERRLLPTAPENMTHAIEGDAAFWAQHGERIRQRFERWLTRDVMVPRGLPH